MKLQYTILWIDDASTWVDSIEDSIKDNADVEVLSIKKENGVNIESLLEENRIDLFLIDKNLQFIQGEEIIKRIRKHGELSQIVFYSQDHSVTSSIDGWDGVISVHRDDVESEAKTFIETFAEYSKSISIMRGMIIAESIDIENILVDIIEKLFGETFQLFQKRVLDKRKLDFNSKWRFVQGCLKEKIQEIDNQDSQNPLLIELRECKKILNDLDEEIIVQRNILAHSKAKFGGNNGSLKLPNLDKQDIVFNNEWKRKVRSDIKKHHKNLYKIAKLI